MNYWAVVPAAGVGSRMGAETPKQYLPLAGRTVLDWTLDKLLGHPAISSVVVVISEQDDWWQQSPHATNPRVISALGGAERVHSVLGGLNRLAKSADPDDWVLVHDAARPCVRPEDISMLISRVNQHPVGGLLGIPVHDTMKRTNRSGIIVRTEEREQLWHAFTPQMFRLGPLQEALHESLEKGAVITDEASALEQVGLMPVMVKGHGDNIKITRPEDLALAAYYLEQQLA